MSPAKKKAFKAKMAAGRAKAAKASSAKKPAKNSGGGFGIASHMTPAQIKAHFKGISHAPGYGVSHSVRPASPSVKKPAGSRRARKIVKAVVKESKKAEAAVKKAVKTVAESAKKGASHETHAQIEHRIKTAAQFVQHACEEKIRGVEKRAMDAFALGNIGRGIRAAHHMGHIPGAPGKAHQEKHVTQMKMQHGREMAALRKRAEQAMELGNIGRPFRAAGQAMFQPRPAAMPPPGHRPPQAGKRPPGRRPITKADQRKFSIPVPTRTQMHHEAREKEPNILAGVPGLKGKRGKATGPLFWVCAGVKRSGCGGGPDGGHVLGNEKSYPAHRMR